MTLPKCAVAIATGGLLAFFVIGKAAGACARLLARVSAGQSRGPCRWCPGDPPVQTGNHVTNPVVWDETVCHTYWYVYFGQGNVAQNIFEGRLRRRRHRRAAAAHRRLSGLPSEAGAAIGVVPQGVTGSR